MWLGGKEVNDHSDAAFLANIPHSNNSNHVVGDFKSKLKKETKRYKKKMFGASTPCSFRCVGADHFAGRNW